MLIMLRKVAPKIVPPYPRIQAVPSCSKPSSCMSSTAFRSWQAQWASRYSGSAAPDVPQCRARAESSTGALANQPFTYPVQSLKGELLNRLDGNKLHGRTPRSLGDRFRLAEIVLLAIRIRPHIPGWYQPRAAAKRHELSAQVMRPTHASMPIRHGGILARRA